MKITCIYRIKSSLFFDKIYIGSSTDYVKRKKNHLRLLRGNRHHSRILQNHFNTYSESDLTFEILKTCSQTSLIKNEQFFIDELKPFFNVQKIADSKLGVTMSEETKQKLREANLGKKFSDETKAKMALAHKGNKSNTGKKLTESHKLNISKGNSDRVFLKGRKASDETKLKISLANKGRVFSDSHKINLSNAISGVKHSEERKKINSKAQVGKKLSIEHKAKISLGLKNSGHIISDETRRKQQETRFRNHGY